ncbi:VanZ family protein [Secundilactobacillus silagei]|uniref:Glycopeptide antibiotics resistance protein n=1 Tax=Secundilactobacillus silagei JCM 19001 TaxID=1302250 RepID=A0A1Z5IIF7_9LACO|nr:VanZ family protein [Secundilactobacillus silagei]TDG73055.1 hypothetical protein C5L25_000696 [Secundilactobacillus silagei JCM 19001]GAX01540.1 glycopeptide antibiotics resistance protein [Secundilactobacillus silagei JCM 19001]
MTNDVQWLPYLAYVFMVMIGIGVLVDRKRTLGQMMTIVTFGFYLAVVGYLTLTPTSYAFGSVPTMKPFWVGNAPTNPIPFRGIEMDFYLNILMMVPMGVYLKLLSKANFRQIVGLGFLIGIGIESTQFLLDSFLQLSRWVDINDVITNAGGVIIGCVVILFLQHSPLKRIVSYFSLRRLS